MNASEPAWPISLSGQSVEMGNWVRRIYIDESGTSGREPVAVVAAVIINADQHYARLATRVDEVNRKHAGNSAGPLPVFHATDIWNGNKNFKDIVRDWSKNQRLSYITDMVEIVSKENIPVALSWIKKDECFKGLDKAEAAKRAHFFAFAGSIAVSDKFISNHYPDERASLVAEKCDHMMQTLGHIPFIFNDQEPDPDSWLFRRKITHIIGDEEIQYMTKRGSPLLQIADAMAWAFQQYLTNWRLAPKLYRPIFGDHDFAIREDLTRRPMGASVLGTLYSSLSDQP
ncbi:DUF3800 domain-containing protein [Sphingobium ummariense]|uniref:DUF3800 domain-containing protein n=1 Tax=Sphingobium ummariense TaxID=420994 RepID=UPI0012681A8E|nr:DUF3800 domain-containing protein [Sphingobium ummariense]